MSNDPTPKDVHSTVREHYGQIASGFQANKTTGCGCTPGEVTNSSCCDSQAVSSQLKIYETTDASARFRNLSPVCRLAAATRLPWLPCNPARLC